MRLKRANAPSSSDSFTMLGLRHTHRLSESTLCRENEKVSEPCSRLSITFTAASTSILWSSNFRLACNFARMGRVSLRMRALRMRWMCGMLSATTEPLRTRENSRVLRSSTHMHKGRSTFRCIGTPKAKCMLTSVFTRVPTLFASTSPRSKRDPRISSNGTGSPLWRAEAEKLCSTSTLHAVTSRLMRRTVAGNTWSSRSRYPRRASAGSAGSSFFTSRRANSSRNSGSIHTSLPHRTTTGSLLCRDQSLR
mmetsp:Transcript_58627/g.117754  ORF Transcript_58627/g.117754 Transcript_58627/m.117754 type:complete len:251 (+) Transcript_58627:2101-2853(+)